MRFGHSTSLCTSRSRHSLSLCGGLDRLDIVNLNAGIAPAKRVFNTSTGHDEVIQVNYLSTALLAILLLPVVEERRANQPRPSRITLTLSEVGSWTRFNEQKEPGSLLEALDSKRGKVDMLDRMWLSKLLGQFLPVRLAAAVPPSAAVINGASPGAVHDSEFNRDFYKTFGGAVFKKLVLKHVGNSSEMAAWAITDATSSTTVMRLTGSSCPFNKLRRKCTYIQHSVVYLRIQTLLLIASLCITAWLPLSLQRWERSYRTDSGRRRWKSCHLPT